jgi:hypothetical protein
MYKVISHEIKEEHFSHPALIPQQLSSSNEGNGLNYSGGPVRPTLTNGSFGIDDPLPWQVFNERTMLFRMDARIAWSKWAYSMLNYSISLNGNLEGTEQVKGRVHKNAIALGDFLVPYYGLTAGNLFATSLIAINDIGMHLVTALKGQQPTAEIILQWIPPVNAIAKLMNELNPNNWPELLIRDQFTNLVRAWQDQLTARAGKNITADEIAIEAINKIAVTGIPDHQRNGYSSIADTYSRGIIAQFPGDFV